MTRRHRELVPEILPSPWAKKWPLSVKNFFSTSLVPRQHSTLDEYESLRHLMYLRRKQKPDSKCLFLHIPVFHRTHQLVPCFSHSFYFLYVILSRLETGKWIERIKITIIIRLIVTFIKATKKAFSLSNKRYTFLKTLQKHYRTESHTKFDKKSKCYSLMDLKTSVKY